jgi:hypothetical protein
MTVAAGSGAVGAAKDVYFSDLIAVLNDTVGTLTPGQKAARLQLDTDGLNTVLACIKAMEKAETYSV